MKKQTSATPAQTLTPVSLTPLYQWVGAVVFAVILAEVTVAFVLPTQMHGFVRVSYYALAIGLLGYGVYLSLLVGYRRHLLKHPLSDTARDAYNLRSRPLYAFLTTLSIIWAALRGFSVLLVAFSVWMLALFAYLVKTADDIAGFSLAHFIKHSNGTAELIAGTGAVFVTLVYYLAPWLIKRAHHKLWRR